jgi:hypothetical protein
MQAAAASSDVLCIGRETKVRGPKKMSALLKVASSEEREQARGGRAGRGRGPHLTCGRTRLVPQEGGSERRPNPCAQSEFSWGMPASWLSALQKEVKCCVSTPVYYWR